MIKPIARIEGTRAEKYEALMPQMIALIQGEDDLIANCANVAAALMMHLDFHWIGFYFMKDGQLVLGPFQGPVACTRIPLDRGVCGAAARTRSTFVVSDVDRFPGHIACSSLSRSEIVVPFVVEGTEQVMFVLDVDSVRLDDFTAVDRRYLEAITAMLGQHHYA